MMKTWWYILRHRKRCEQLIILIKHLHQNYNVFVVAHAFHVIDISRRKQRSGTRWRHDISTTPGVLYAKKNNALTYLVAFLPAFKNGYAKLEAQAILLVIKNRKGHFHTDFFLQPKVPPPVCHSTGSSFPLYTVYTSNICIWWEI